METLKDIATVPERHGIIFFFAQTEPYRERDVSSEPV